MADFETDIMSKHFAAAGVEAPVEEGNATQPAAESGNETVAAPSGQEDKTSQSAPEQDIIGDAKPKPGPKTEQSGKPDSKQEQGKEEKGQSTGNPNDLTLPDGTIVKAGAERRWYQTAMLARQETGTVRQELNTLKQERDKLAEKVTAFTEASKAAGVADPTEMSTALTLFRDLRQNPVNTVKLLLTDLKAKGYAIDDIGSAVDTAAISRMIDQKLNTSVDAQGVSPEQAQAEAVREVQQFYANAPDAVIHDELLGAIVAKQAEMGQPVSIQQAYFSLKQAAISQDLDWSQPLGPQIEAKKAAIAKPITPGPGPVGGKTINGSSVEVDPSKVNVQYDTFDDAIVASMREAGMQIDR